MCSRIELHCHIGDAISRRHLASDGRYLFWLRKSFMATNTMRLATSSFACMRVKSHDSVAKGILLHLMVASHATMRLIARRCPLGTRPQWPASPIVAAVTRDETQYTSSATPVALYSLRCANPFRVIPFYLVSRRPGIGAGTWRCPREFDEDEQLTPDPNRAPKFPFEGSRRLKFAGWFAR